jgi:hypothetical protein
MLLLIAYNGIMFTKQSSLPLAVVREDKGRQHDGLGGLPVDVDGQRVAGRRRAGRHGDNGQARRRGDGVDRRAAGRIAGRRVGTTHIALRVREPQRWVRTVLDVVVIRAVVVGAQRVVVGTVAVVVGRILVQHRGGCADEAVLLVVRQTQDLLQHVLRVEDDRRVVDRRLQRRAQRVDRHRCERKVIAGADDRRVARGAPQRRREARAGRSRDHAELLVAAHGPLDLAVDEDVLGRNVDVERHLTLGGSYCIKGSVCTLLLPLLS